MKNNHLQVSIYPVTDLLSLAIANAAEIVASVRHSLPLIGDSDDRLIALMVSTDIRIILQRLKGSVGGKALTSFRNLERLVRSEGWDPSLMEGLVIKDVEEASSLGIMSGAIALKQILTDKLKEWEHVLVGPLNEFSDTMDDADQFSRALFCEIMSVETLIEQEVERRVRHHFRKDNENHPPVGVRPVLVSPTNLIGILTSDNISDLMQREYVSAAVKQNRVQMGRQWLNEITDAMEKINQTAEEMAETRIAVMNSIKEGIRKKEGGYGPSEVLPGVNSPFKGA